MRLDDVARNFLYTLMSVRITTEDAPRDTIRIDGDLRAADVVTLLDVCGEKGPRLLLDLSGLQHADDVGIQLLKMLRDDGALLHGARPYVAMLLGHSK